VGKAKRAHHLATDEFNTGGHGAKGAFAHPTEWKIRLIEENNPDWSDLSHLL
jgi:hypothetical protein